MVVFRVFMGLMDIIAIIYISSVGNYFGNTIIVSI